MIGNTGQEVTAAFAQSPGALQLLPTAQYAESQGWLTIDSPSGLSIHTEPSASGDPCQDIYRRRDRWWGLVREEWLNLPGGTGLEWEDCTQTLDSASGFHASIKNSNHPNTYVFYGSNKNPKIPKIPSFEGVHWQIRKGAIRLDRKTPSSPEAITEMGFEAVRDEGSNRCMSADSARRCRASVDATPS